jgi:hypothetical protein
MTYVYYSTISGTYAQGTFPSARYIRYTIDCNTSFCDYSADPVSQTYTFQGISTSSTTFTPVSSSYNFQSTMSYNQIQSGPDSTFPFVYQYTLNSTQTNLINALDSGTYYIWADGASRGVLTITSVSILTTVSVTKDFVIKNKTDQNPIKATITWDNPTGQNFYYYAALSDTSSPSTGILYGFFGPYSMPSGANGSATISAQFKNVNQLSDGTNLYLVSYKNTSST